MGTEERLAVEEVEVVAVRVMPLDPVGGTTLWVRGTVGEREGVVELEEHLEGEALEVNDMVALEPWVKDR